MNESKLKKEQQALLYHSMGKPGKIEVVPTKPHSTQRDLSLAYTPGVAVPCLEINKDVDKVYDYTAKGNLVAVISNGTAVLGLGDIGPEAGKPVMEGKGLLFKIFAGIDVFDIEVNEKDPEKFIQTVKAIAPTFGGINLEDIKAPECFEIETRLKAELDIPVMHDDQHGTAIISSAALLNGLQIANKKIEDCRLVVNGAGSAGSSCTRLYMSLGVKRENVVMVDSQGVIRKDRENLSPAKAEFATDRTDITTLADAMKDADIFLGVSVADVLTQDMIRSMAKDPLVFACANPNPEIAYDLAMASRPDIIFATGRSDYPNQINNVLGFPFIFRGALDTRATAINEEMKIAAVYAIADLAKQPVPDVVNKAYGLQQLSFGRSYILPKPMDPRLITKVSAAVARAAIDSGVARKTIDDWQAYENELNQLMGYDNSLVRSLYDMAKTDPKRVVYAEPTHVNILKAAAEALQEGICEPILLGDTEQITRIAEEQFISLEGMTILPFRSESARAQREQYAQLLAIKRARSGCTFADGLEKMYDANYFGMMMVEVGDADAFITGVQSNYCDTSHIAKDVIGIQDGFSHFATMHILHHKKGNFFVADTMINRHPTTETLVDIARLAKKTVDFFNEVPVMAMLSYSNFGSDKVGSPANVHEAVRQIQESNPDLAIDGEMQVNFALNKELRDKTYPFSRLKGRDVNTLVFPNLSSANTAYKLLKEFGHCESIGPIQMGLKKPVHFTGIESSVRDIVTLTAVAVIDAIVHKSQAKESI